MTNDQRQEIINQITFEVKAIAESKGNAYAGTEDSLANFKRNAEAIGLTKYQVWNIYFSKHLDSIRNAIKQNPEKPIDKSEGLHGRIIDAITYLTILECLLKEDNLL